MLAAVQRAQLDDAALGHHFPIYLDLQWRGTATTLTLRDPARLPVEAQRPLAEESNPTWQWHPYMEELAQALEDQNSDQATRSWMKRWEALLAQRAEQHGALLTPGMLGRGQLPQPAPLRRARTRHQSDMTDTIGEALRKLRNLLIDQEVRHLHGEELTPQQARRLHSLLQQCQAYLPGPSRDDDAANPWRTAHELLQEVRATIRQREATIAAERLRRWRAQVAETTRAGTKKAHTYIKGQRLAALHQVRSPTTGELVVQPADMHQALRTAWAPVDNPVTTLTAEQSRQLSPS